MSFQKLTLKLLKEKYWDSTTNTCKPITTWSTSWSEDLKKDQEELIFTGNLYFNKCIDDPDSEDVCYENWLSGKCEVCVEGSNMLENNTYSNVEIYEADGEYYLSFDACEGIDIWVPI